KGTRSDRITAPARTLPSESAPARHDPGVWAETAAAQSTQVGLDFFLAPQPDDTYLKQCEFYGKTKHRRKNNMKRNSSTKTSELRQRRDAPLVTPTDLTRSATEDITGAMNAILADVFALYLKTKNFHWHMSGPHFRDYHLLLDEHGDQLFAMTDPIAERVRKIGGLT